LVWWLPDVAGEHASCSGSVEDDRRRLAPVERGGAPAWGQMRGQALRPPFACLSTRATAWTVVAPPGRVSEYPASTVALLVGAQTTSAPPDPLVSSNRAIATSACPELTGPL